MRKINYNDIFVKDDIHTGEHIFYVDHNNIEPFNGVIVDYNDGILVWEFEVQDGFRSGIERVFYPTGELQELNETDHNTINGIAKEFYKNGKLKSQSIVIGNVHIFIVTFNENGSVVDTWKISEEDPSYDVVRDRIPEYRSRYKFEI